MSELPQEESMFLSSFILNLLPSDLQLLIYLLPLELFNKLLATCISVQGIEFNYYFILFFKKLIIPWYCFNYFRVGLKAYLLVSYSL